VVSSITAAVASTASVEGVDVPGGTWGTRGQRLEGGLLGGLAGGGQRGEGAAVEGVEQRDDLGSGRAPVGLPPAAGQLDGRLVGGGPAVGEEHPVEPGQAVRRSARSTIGSV
jgi:hypothetical protein